MTIRLSKFLKEPWLRKQDIESMTDEERSTTITRVYTKRVGQEDRLIVSFATIDRHLPLNQANLKELVTACGGTDDATEFLGLRVELYIDEGVEYQGEAVGGIRLEAQAKAKPAVKK